MSRGKNNPLVTRPRWAVMIKDDCYGTWKGRTAGGQRDGGIVRYGGRKGGNWPILWKCVWPVVILTWCAVIIIMWQRIWICGCVCERDGGNTCVGQFIYMCVWMRECSRFCERERGRERYRSLRKKTQEQRLFSYLHPVVCNNLSFSVRYSNTANHFKTKSFLVSIRSLTVTSLCILCLNSVCLWLYRITFGSFDMFYWVYTKLV